MSESDPALSVRPLLLRITEVAVMLSVSRTKVYELIAAGELASVKVGGSRRVPIDAVEAFVAGLMTQPAAGSQVE